MRTENTLSIKELATALKNDQQFALFVGAGISVNAGIPSSGSVITILRKQYPGKFQVNRNYAYAEAFNAALPGKEHQADRRRFIEELFAGKPPGEEHYLVAHLVEHRKFPIVFTTNFDHLTEIALINLCSLQPRIYLFDSDIEPKEYSDEFPKLLKLHGDFLFDDLANLEEETRNRMNENIRSKLLTYMQERGLVVVGYGGNDESIMNLLEEVIQAPGGMKNGLWWVIYEKKDLYNTRLTRLIKETRRQRKRAEIVGPIDAARFFKNLLSSLELGSQQPVLFGINPKQRNFVSTYVGRFGKARQLPPMDDDKILKNDLSDELSKLEEALKIPGVVLLIGPPQSGKSTLIGKLFEKLGSKRLFYFSHRFARNPVLSCLMVDLEIYASAVGIPISRLLYLMDMLQHLFRKDVVLVFDDLFLESSPTWEQFWEMLLDIIAVQANVRHGNIILISSQEPAEEVLIEIHHAMLESAFGKGQPFSTKQGEVITNAPASRTLITSDKNLQQLMKFHSSRNMLSFWPRNYRLRPEDVGVHMLKISGSGESSEPKQSFEASIKNLFENGLPEVRKALRVMALLRFAEYPDVLGRLTEISNIRNILEILVQDQLVEKRGNKYVLRDSVKTFLRHFDPTIEKDTLNVAHRFEKISADQSYFYKAHYTIEAEYHYWLAECPKEAAYQLLKVGNILIAQNVKFIYPTLLNYFLLEASGKPIISNLEPHVQVKLILLLYQAWQATLPPDYTLFPSLYKEIIEKVLSKLDEVYERLFAAYQCYYNYDFNGFKEHLLSAEGIFRTRSISRELGDIQLDLSGCAFSQSTIVQDNEQKAQQLVAEGLSWAKKAEKTYLKIDNQKGVARAIDNIASAMLKLGKYREALKLEEEQRGLQAAEPGFTLDKAVVYGNLFQANLLLANIKEAEGYFYQCILNYAYLGGWTGMLRNLCFLFDYTLKSRRKHGLPTSYSLYCRIISTAKILAGSREVREIREIALYIIYKWFYHNLAQMRLRSVLIALKDFFWLSHIIPEEQLVSEGLFMVGIAVKKFHNEATQKQLLLIIEEEVPSSLNLYSCYFQWLMNPQVKLNQLLKQYKVDPKWEQVIRKEWSKCQRLNFL